MKELFLTNANCMKLVALFPSFQPRHHLFNKNTKFIGCCIDENTRLANLSETVVQILEKFPPINPVNPKNAATKDNVLVYIIFH
jgi:hypothetical protein